MEKQMSNGFSRFLVFLGEKNDATVQRLLKVGSATIREGQTSYSLRLWMWKAERYYLIPSKVDPAKYLVMVREPNMTRNARNKYFWNIVGNGVVNSALGVLEIKFDMLIPTVYMSLYPEATAASALVPPPDEQDDLLKAA